MNCTQLATVMTRLVGSSTTATESNPRCRTFRRFPPAVRAATVILALCASVSTQAQDCNGNGIPDDCDISCGDPGGPCDVPGCGLSEDCNGNGIPDECDIALAGPPAGGMTLWLRADSGVTVDADAVTRWADQSGLGNDYLPVVGYGSPSLIPDVLNYQPVVEFDGIDDRLTNGGQLITGNQFTIVAVISVTAGDYAWEVGGGYPYRVFYERGPGAGDPEHTGNTLDVAHDNGNDARAAYPGISAPGFRTLSILADQTLSGTQVYVNGHAAEMQLTGTDQTWQLGSGQNNLGWIAYPAFGQVDVAEFIVYNRLLSDAERRYVERYLGAKYFGTVEPDDCDGNGVPDECEWVDCNNNGVFDACDIAEGVSSDCNGNGVPDECDIAEGTSEDCMDGDGYAGAPNGIPDECDLEHVDLVHSRSNPAPTTQPWSSENTWCPALAPDNNGNHTFDVTLASGMPITLDISPTITALSIESGAALEVNESSGASVRILAADGPVNNGGFVRALDGKRLVLDAPQLPQTGAAELQAGAASCIQINGSRVIGGVARATGEDSRIELLGGAVLEDVTIYGEVGRDGPSEAVRVPGGQYGQVAGTITNMSLVGVGTDPAPAPAFLFTDASGATLAGQGWLRLGNPNAFLFVSDGIFLNGPEHTIAGSGWIFGGPANLGMIIADRPGESLFLRSGELITNDGVLAATAGGTLEIENPISGAGGLEADTGGTLLIAENTAILLDGAVDIHDGGQFRRDSGVATATLSAGSLAVLGTTMVEPATLVELDGTLDTSINGPVLIDGVQTCPFRGCTPPILHVRDTASLEAQTLDIVTGGELQLDGSACVQVAGPVTLDGGVLRGVDPSAVTLTAGSLALTDTAGTTGQLLLGDGMQLDVAGDLVVDAVSPGSNRGCTPPILHALGSTAVTVGGAFVESGAATVEVTTSDFQVSGDFDIGSTDPTTFHWQSGGLRLTASGAVHFEAAGTDRGLDPAGWTDNFALGRLEVGNSGSVEFRDVRDNDVKAQGPCSEAVYVDTLVLRAGARLILNNCRVYTRHLLDDGGLVQTIGCGELLSPSRGAGDLNCDGSVDVFDIDPFIMALTAPDGYAAQFPACDYMRADVSRDDQVNSFDIDPFVRLLMTGCCGHSLPILLVACRTSGAVLAFNGSTGQFIRELVPPGGGLSNPNQIVAGPDDSFYIASAYTNSVVQFSIRSGQQMLAFTGGGLTGPDGVALRTGEVLVASFSDGTVKRFDAFSAEPLGDLVESHAGGLDGSSGLQLRSNGNLLVASQHTDQVLEYDAQGIYLGLAAVGGELHTPYALLLDSQGDLLVASFGNDAVLRYGPDGSFLGCLASPGTGGLDGPGGLAELPDRSILVASRYNNRVLRYAPDGTFVGTFATGGGLSQPTGVALLNVCDRDCNGNGILDRWDIDLGLSTDLDGDGVPDECE